MDRNITYRGAIPYETDILTPQRHAMVGLGRLAEAVLGRSTLANGFETTAFSPANLSVNVGPGVISYYTAIDATPYGGVTDNNSIVKLGGTEVTQNFAMTAPTSSGQTVIYLIQAAFDGQDDLATVLPYYNAANPANPLSGPAGAGTSQNTRRKAGVAVQAKRGTPAATGSAAIPAASAGYVPLYIVTIDYGQNSITAAHIQKHPEYPAISKLSERWAPLDSPTFSGTPTAPTRTAGDNSTKLATTAYADAAVANLGSTSSTANTLAKRDGSGRISATAFLGNATSADSAGHATTANTATNATNATNAQNAQNANYATNAGTAASANSALTALNATNAGTAVTATNATKLGNMVPAEAATPSTVAIRDAGGHLTANNFNGVATSAKFADLAERFAASEPLEEGDVVDLTGHAEIGKARGDFLGVISANPGFRMNEAAGTDDTHPFVAYSGRVPVKVKGEVAKGDYITLSDEPGVAVRGGDRRNSIGRALAPKAGADIGLVMCVVK